MISVLTGDIVGSQELSPKERAQLSASLHKAAEFAKLSSSFEVFGGDSWQAKCSPPQGALFQAVAFRSFLYGSYGIDTRISLGIGGYETIHEEKISLSQGEAFVLSGQGLKTIPEKRRLAIHLTPDLSAAISHLLAACCVLLDGLSSGWTEKQAYAVALACSSFPDFEKTHQKDLAARFDPPISPQAYGKHLASSSWDLVRSALQSISNALEKEGIADHADSAT